MVSSPALAHRQRKLAALASGSISAGGAPAMPKTGDVATEYQKQMMALGQDLRRLSDIQSIERKIEAKRGMILAYLPWVLGALDGDSGTQDEVVSTILIWAIDTGDWTLALQIAGYVLKHGIALPERYKRQPAVLIAEECAEAGLGATPSIGLNALMEVAELTADQDMPDQVRAKLEKAIGLALSAQAEAWDATAESSVAGGKPALIAAALTRFHRALELDSGSGVKKLIEKLEREAKKLAEAAAA